MKKLITFTLFLVSASFLGAQTTSDDYYTAAQPKLFSRDRVSASVSGGAGVSFLNTTKNTAFTSFIAPKIGYQVNNRFKLNIGLMHYSITGNTFMPINQQEALFNSGNKTRNGNLLFVEGQYLLTKKVLVSGAVLYDANNFNNRQSNYKAVALGFDYQVSKHSTVGFKAVISQGENSYYNTHTGMYGGFGDTAPMGQMFGGLGQDFTQRMNAAIR